MAHGEAFEAQVVHAVAVAWGGLQATKRPRAIWVVGARASNVLPYMRLARPVPRLRETGSDRVWFHFSNETTRRDYLIPLNKYFVSVVEHRARS